MRDTNIIEKVTPPLINATAVIIITAVVWWIYGNGMEFKLVAIFTFYIIQIADTHEHLDFRCFGMRIFGTQWAKPYTKLQRNFYSILYTLSFSTLFFYIYVPFDLFVFNILFLQLPTILVTGTTLHGWLAGGMRTVVK